MKRREFLKSTVVAPLGANFSFQGDRKEKPNLLFLWTDQQRADTMRVYGNGKISVPNLNRLAEESVVFRNCYVSQPICTPSRSTVLTGLWPHANGCKENNVPLPASVPCVPEIIADPSYRTGYFGKWHLGDEPFAQHGFEEWESIEDIYIEHYTPGRDPNRRSSYHEFLLGLGYKPAGPDGTFGRLAEAKLPIQHCKPRFLETKACDFLRRHKNEPFILYVNFLEPHPPYYGPLNERYKPREMELEASFADLLEDDEPLAYRIRRERVQEKRAEGMDLRTDEGWRRLAANYWGSVTHVDGSVGKILDTLEDLGLAGNTVVMYTSDHGEMLGAHRMLNKGVMYEEATRVPWLVRAPRFGRRRRIVEGRFSHIDLVPTLLDLMGRQMPGRFPGRSLLPDLERGGPVREHLHIEWNPQLRSIESDSRGVPWPAELAQKALGAHTRTVIAPDGWKLCLSDADRHQLFNLEADPWEKKNLYYTGQHRDVVRRLAARIRDWQQGVRDPIVLPSVE